MSEGYYGGVGGKSEGRYGWQKQAVTITQDTNISAIGGCSVGYRLQCFIADSLVFDDSNRLILNNYTQVEWGDRARNTLKGHYFSTQNYVGKVVVGYAVGDDYENNGDNYVQNYYAVTGTINGSAGCVVSDKNTDYPALGIVGGYQYKAVVT